MPGIEVKACAAFMKFGIRKLSGNTVGEIVVFADGKRYDFGGYADTQSANLSVQKLSDGSFKVADRWYDDGEGGSREGLKIKTYVVKMIDPLKLEIGEGKVRAEYIKCVPTTIAASGRPDYATPAPKAETEGRNT